LQSIKSRDRRDRRDAAAWESQQLVLAAQTAAWLGFLQHMDGKYPAFCFDPKELQELVGKHRRARLFLRAGYDQRAIALLAWSPAIRALA